METRGGGQGHGRGWRRGLQLTCLSPGTPAATALTPPTWIEWALSRKNAIAQLRQFLYPSLSPIVLLGTILGTGGTVATTTDKTPALM